MKRRKKEKVLNEQDLLERDKQNALARYRGEPLPYPENDPGWVVPDEEIRRRRDLNKLARSVGNPMPYPEVGADDAPRIIQTAQEEQKHAADHVIYLKDLQYIYIGWAYLYKDYIPFEVVEKCEKESFQQAKKTFNPEGEETFALHYSIILRKKLDYAKSQAFLPRRITDAKEIEEVKIKVEYWKKDYIDNPQKHDDEEPGDGKPPSDILELPQSMEKDMGELKKKEKQYVALLVNLGAIPLDKMAAQELGVSREAITRKGGIKDRVRQKLGEGWELELLPNRYDF